MKRFEMRQLEQAVAYALTGGQALHVCPSAPFVTAAAPKVFRDSEQFAHLFDQNRRRLIETARGLGVRVIKLERGFTPRQHIDLCGKPLQKALQRCENAQEAQTALAL